MEAKAIPYDLVASDKGQKARNIGIAFYKEGGKVPISITLSMTRLKKAIDDRIVSTRKEEPSKTKYKNVYEGEETVRIACFQKVRRPTDESQ